MPKQLELPEIVINDDEIIRELESNREAAAPVKSFVDAAATVAALKIGEWVNRTDIYKQLRRGNQLTFNVTGKYPGSNATVTIKTKYGGRITLMSTILSLNLPE